MIVVLDTNVYVSAFQFSRIAGTPALAVSRAMNDDVIATCDQIETELFRVLTQRFHWTSSRAKAIIQIAFERAVRVEIFGSAAICRDPEDNMLLECAERSEARLLVTGDKDLLVIRNYKQVEIVTPAVYLTL
jgi:putative PIN family toxin of toxin-antitoxin system